MKVSIIGCGYVGLVTGVCLADKGHHVVCVDLDARKVDAINKGIAPIHENGLPELLKKTIGKGFSASTDLSKAVLESEITLIAVGTPFDGRQIDLSYVKKTTEQIAGVLAKKDTFHVVVVKSTVVPGTTDEIVKPILQSTCTKKGLNHVAQQINSTDSCRIGVGMNPEFLSEGQAIEDFMHPDRIILGAGDDRTIEVMTRLYADFDGVPMIRTNTRTAEMIKYASNALLATCISFANEIANLCGTVGGIDPLEVMRANQINQYLSRRLPDGTIFQAPLAGFLEPGCGFGGSCLPKDVSALIAHGNKLGAPMPLLQAVIDTNQNQPRKVIQLLRSRLGDLGVVPIAVLGLAFKPDTDDMRESPAVPIIEHLISAGAFVKAYDPTANGNARRVLAGKSVAIVDTMKEAVSGAKAVVIVTKWDEFKGLPKLLDQTNPNTLVIDCRRLLDKQSVRNYASIGMVNV